MLSRKLSDRVKIQTTYQGRPDKDEEAPLDDASSRFVRGSLASPESRASLRSAQRGITEPAVQQRLRARWITGDWCGGLVSSPLTTPRRRSAHWLASKKPAPGSTRRPTPARRIACVRRCEYKPFADEQAAAAVPSRPRAPASPGTDGI